VLLVTYTLGIELWFRVFVREHHDGSATVHALEAPHVFAYAGSPKAEVARMTKVLAEFVVSISRGYQGNFVFREDQELRRLDVDVKPRGKVEEEIPISVSLLVTRQPHIRKERYVITAPRFYGFHLMVMEEDEIEEKAQRLVTLRPQTHLPSVHGPGRTQGLRIHSIQPRKRTLRPLPEGQ